MRSVALSRAIPYLASLALIRAGRQLTSWKQSCLGHCRDPLLLVNHAGDGWRGAFRLGIHQGAFCIVFCWALMLVQLAVGIMNLALMALIALAIAVEKMLPRGPLLAVLPVGSLPQPEFSALFMYGLADFLALWVGNCRWLYCPSVHRTVAPSRFDGPASGAQNRLSSPP